MIEQFETNELVPVLLMQFQSGPTGNPPRWDLVAVGSHASILHALLLGGGDSPDVDASEAKSDANSESDVNSESRLIYSAAEKPAMRWDSHLTTHRRRMLCLPQRRNHCRKLPRSHILFLWTHVPVILEKSRRPIRSKDDIQADKQP